MPDGEGIGLYKLGVVGLEFIQMISSTISHRYCETYQTTSIGQTVPTPSVDIPGACGEGNETQNRSNGVVRETYTYHQAVFKSVIHQKQAIADSSGQAARVWEPLSRTFPQVFLTLD